MPTNVQDESAGDRGKGAVWLSLVVPGFRGKRKADDIWNLRFGRREARENLAVPVCHWEPALSSEAGLLMVPLWLGYWSKLTCQFDCYLGSTRVKLALLHFFLIVFAYPKRFLISPTACQIHCSPPNLAQSLWLGLVN